MTTNKDAIESAATSKDAIESVTTNKDGFKKAVRLRQTEAFRTVRVGAVKADSFKAVGQRPRAALDRFKAIGIHFWVSKRSCWL